MDDPVRRIEHTVLGPQTTWADVSTVLDEALRYGMRACIPHCYVERGTEYAPGVDISTVVSFPHGQDATEAKAEAAIHAWDAGVGEIDVVANLGYLRTGNDDALEADLAEVVAAVPLPVKVITEAPLLETADLRRLAEAAVAVDADFLKTATGFGAGGAAVDDVELLSQYRPVKASGGISSWPAAEALFDAGADRIGASSGVTIVEEFREQHEHAGTDGSRPGGGDQAERDQAERDQAERDQAERDQAERDLDEEQSID